MRLSTKIRPIQELPQAFALHRAEGKKIVLCHGVFDLLHIGHIRYLEKAKRQGDLLVVTLTPDRYVNKGPHRPVFTERLRAESLAALACVNYVAINEWPTAVETIELLKPDIYAKGAEFRSHRTPEILREEEAVEALGANIAFIEDVTSSSSSLINKYLSPFEDNVDQYLAGLAQACAPSDILKYIDQAKDLKVLVVGETIIDEYYHCTAIGRSSKAPIVAMQYRSHERFAGGAAVVANHLADFCGSIGLLSMVGARDDEEGWVRQQLKDKVQANFLRKADSPTIAKRRYREMNLGMPVFETYVMNDEPLTADDNDALCAYLGELLPRYDMVIMIDYGHGMMTEKAIETLVAKSAFLAVNAQSNAGNVGCHTISKYRRANYVCLAEQELRLEYRRMSGDLRPMLKQLAERLLAPRAVVTRGKYGCLCYGDETGFTEAPSLAVHVRDRVGAGDTFLAISSLCAFQGANMEALAFLGNVAGAEAVASVGTGKALEKMALSRHVVSLMK